MSEVEAKNMALARRFIEVRVKGDLDAMDEMMASDFVNHTKLSKLIGDVLCGRQTLPFKLE